MATGPVQLFLSYASEDQALAERFIEHLGPLKRLGVVSLWHAGLVSAGEHWGSAIERHLAEAQLVVFLISASFLASEQSQREVDIAIDKRRREEATVVPVIVRALRLDRRSTPRATGAAARRQACDLLERT